MSVYFTPEEIKDLDNDFVELLDLARKLSGVTFELFHADKRDEKNRKDVSIRCVDEHARFHIIRSLLNAGLNRFGWNDEYVQVEYDRKPINRVWFIK